MMLDGLMPRNLNNEYRGSRPALWIFGLVVVMKSAQRLAIIFSPHYTATSAEGIPLDSFTPTAAQTVVAVFAQGSLWRLFFCLVCGLVLFRYRNAVPLMLALLGLSYLAGELVFGLVPISRVGPRQIGAGRDAAEAPVRPLRVVHLQPFVGHLPHLRQRGCGGMGLRRRRRQSTAPGSRSSRAPLSA